jgi:hypothetical protein
MLRNVPQRDVSFRVRHRYASWPRRVLKLKVTPLFSHLAPPSRFQRRDDIPAVHDVYLYTRTYEVKPALFGAAFASTTLSFHSPNGEHP